MRFVLYVSRLPRNLLLLFVERVFVSASGAVCDAPEGIKYKTRFAGFMRWSRIKNTLTPLELTQTERPDVTEFAKRRHDAVKAQMLYGGIR